MTHLDWHKEPKIIDAIVSGIIIVMMVLIVWWVTEITDRQLAELERENVMDKYKELP